jgi:hypothetical protein
VPLRSTLAAFLLAGACLAQLPENDLQTAIRRIRYLPLAEVARVQGDVRLKSDAGTITVISGPPLLAQAAVGETKTFAQLLVNGSFDLTYHFGFVDTVRTVPIVRKKGNAFERALLRLTGRKTDEVVLVCDSGCSRTSSGTLIAGR